MDQLPNAIFDARLGVYSCLADAFELILWRSYDCAVNAVSTTLYLEPLPGYSRREVGCMNTLQKLVTLHEAGRMVGMTHHQRYGTLFHRNRKFCELTNHFTGEVEYKGKYVVEEIDGLIVNSVKENKIVVLS